MASEKSPLTVIRSPAAIDELDGVWRWNADHYSLYHADAYLRFLKESIAELAGGYAKGKTVSSRPDLRDIIIRRRASGHGHTSSFTISMIKRSRSCTYFTAPKTGNQS